MEDGSGWFADPEVEGQERYYDGSEWTSETRPADSNDPLPHLPDHVPELQRAFAAATADIEEVEAQLGRLFDRAQGDGAKPKKGRKAAASKPDPDPGPAAHAEFAASADADADAGAGADADGQPAAQADDSAQAIGVETLLGTEADEDDDSLADLDAALANEEPEKLKRSPFRRRS
jgi:hypothetical protein